MMESFVAQKLVVILQPHSTPYNPVSYVENYGSHWQIDGTSLQITSLAWR